VPEKPVISTPRARPLATTQPWPRTVSWTAATPVVASRARRASASASSPAAAGSSTSSSGERASTSPISTPWKPDMAASDSTSAATPSARPPAATAERKLAKASRRVLLR
jgi:hypothetical protein